MKINFGIVTRVGAEDFQKFHSIAKNSEHNVYFLLILDNEYDLLNAYDSKLNSKNISCVVSSENNNLFLKKELICFVELNEIKFINFCEKIEYLNIDLENCIEEINDDIIFINSSSPVNIQQKLENKKFISYEIFSLIYLNNMVVSSSHLLDVIDDLVEFKGSKSHFIFDNADSIFVNRRNNEIEHNHCGGMNVISLRNSYDFYKDKDSVIIDNIIKFLSDPKSALILFDRVPWGRSGKLLSFLFSEVLDQNIATGERRIWLPLEKAYVRSIILHDNVRLMSIIKNVFQNGFGVATIRKTDFSDAGSPLQQRPLGSRDDEVDNEPKFPLISKVSRFIVRSTGDTADVGSSCVKPLNFGIMGNGGFGVHRDGWSYVLQAALEHFGHNDKGLGFDAFMEKSFVWNFPTIMRDRDRPWIGISHRPPNIPEFYDSEFQMQFYENPFFYNVCKSLKGIVTMSSDHAEFLRRHLGVPTRAIIHPTNHAVEKWREDRIDFENVKLVQIGTWLRKMHSIYQLPPGKYEKFILAKSHEALTSDSRFQAEARILKEQGVDLSRAYATTQLIPFLTNEEYDALLSKCVIFLDLYDATANNTVLEAIARHTPIIVRRLPATVEYLGGDYPLYFDTLEEAAEIGSDKNRILKAHHMLKELSVQDKFHTSGFCESLSSAVTYFENNTP